VPLALNIYTAVHNSISIKGRLSLCKGVLQSVDLRNVLKEIDCPLICIHSTQDAFARPLHTDSFVSKRAGEVRSIHKVLQNPRKTCVVWVKGGHEVFQENKKQLQLVLEQILTGFHENHDISFPTGKYHIWRRFSACAA
jgi:pimeloyl-ACP methyl ester carboxylesterase